MPLPSRQLQRPFGRRLGMTTPDTRSPPVFPDNLSRIEDEKGEMNGGAEMGMIGVGGASTFWKLGAARNGERRQWSQLLLDC